MARIEHPRPEIGRQKAFELEFVDGFAEADLTDAPNLTAALNQHGYTITETVDAEPPAKPSAGPSRGKPAESGKPADAPSSNQPDED